MSDIDASPPLARSFLYAPADRPDRYAKALGRAGDAVIFDLEDAVAPAGKDEGAREQLAGWLAGLDRPRPQVWVRVNSGERLARDVAAVVTAAVTGIIVPKAMPSSVAAASTVLTAVEREQGLTPGRLRISPLIESAAGLLAAGQTASIGRVSHLGIGEADLAADLGLIDPDDATWLSLRLQLVVASAAAGLPGPNGPVDTKVHDHSCLAASSHALRRIGYGSRSALHPDQVPLIEAAFTPTQAEVDQAAAVIASLDASTSGGATDSSGRFVDEAVARSARRVLDLAARSNTRMAP